MTCIVMTSKCTKTLKTFTSLWSRVHAHGGKVGGTDGLPFNGRRGMMVPFVTDKDSLPKKLLNSAVILQGMLSKFNTQFLFCYIAGQVGDH